MIIDVKNGKIDFQNFTIQSKSKFIIKSVEYPEISIFVCLNDNETNNVFSTGKSFGLILQKIANRKNIDVSKLNTKLILEVKE